LAQIFTLYPLAYDVLKVVSIVYLLYLAWKIATAASPHAERKSGAPLTFLQAALFQWVNPKAWTMALAAITVYSPTQSMTAIALVAVIFGVINIPCVSTWTVLGQQMQRLLTNPMRLRAFNMLMAALLVASLYPILFP